MNINCSHAQIIPNKMKRLLVIILRTSFKEYVCIMCVEALDIKSSRKEPTQHWNQGANMWLLWRKTHICKSRYYKKKNIIKASCSPMLPRCNRRLRMRKFVHCLRLWRYCWQNEQVNPILSTTLCTTPARLALDLFLYAISLWTKK